jgi:phosphomannomutase
MGIYKSYDIRGVWGRDWDAATARAIGRALPAVLGAREVCVGRDARLSSDEAFAAFAEGVREAGAGVADIGRCDTPAVYFATARYGFDAGVMITASRREIFSPLYSAGLCDAVIITPASNPYRAVAK